MCFKLPASSLTHWSTVASSTCHRRPLDFLTSTLLYINPSNSLGKRIFCKCVCIWPTFGCRVGVILLKLFERAICPRSGTELHTWHQVWCLTCHWLCFEVGRDSIIKLPDPLAYKQQSCPVGMSPSCMVKRGFAIHSIWPSPVHGCHLWNFIYSTPHDYLSVGITMDHVITASFILHISMINKFSCLCKLLT